MRRLIEFEQEIVKEINKRKEVEFTDFPCRFFNNEICFEVGYLENSDIRNLLKKRKEQGLEGEPPVEDLYFIRAYLKVDEIGIRAECATLKDDPESFRPKGITLRPNDEDGRKIFTYLHNFKCLFDLFILLEQNGFIKTNHAFERDNPLPRLHVFYGDENILDSQHASYYLKEQNFKIDLLFYFKSFSLATPALEIYVNNGCRTDQQKLSDESIEHNNESRRQADKAIEVAGSSARQARNAVLATVILGLLTLLYSCYRDHKNDQKEPEVKVNLHRSFLNR